MRVEERCSDNYDPEGILTHYILQDEKAKRDRDRTKWNSLMDEIAKLKTKVLRRLMHDVPI